MFVRCSDVWKGFGQRRRLETAVGQADSVSTRRPAGSSERASASPAAAWCLMPARGEACFHFPRNAPQPPDLLETRLGSGTGRQTWKQQDTGINFVCCVKLLGQSHHNLTTTGHVLLQNRNNFLILKFNHFYVNYFILIYFQIINFFLALYNSH